MTERSHVSKRPCFPFFSKSIIKDHHWHRKFWGLDSLSIFFLYFCLCGDQLSLNNTENIIDFGRVKVLWQLENDEHIEKRLVCYCSWVGGLGRWALAVATYHDYYCGTLWLMGLMVTTGDYCHGAQLLILTIGNYSLPLLCTIADGDYWSDTAEETLWLLPWHYD